MWGRTFVRVCTEPYASRHHNASMRILATVCNAKFAQTKSSLRHLWLTGKNYADEFYKVVMPRATEALSEDLYRRGGVPEMLRLLVSGVFRRYRQMEAARFRREPEPDGDEEDRWDVYGIDYMQDSRRQPKILEVNSQCVGCRTRHQAPNITWAMRDKYDESPYRHEVLRIVLTHFLRGDASNNNKFKSAPDRDATYDVSACEAEMQMDRLPVV